MPSTSFFFLFLLLYFGILQLVVVKIFLYSLLLISMNCNVSHNKGLFTVSSFFSIFLLLLYVNCFFSFYSYILSRPQAQSDYKTKHNGNSVIYVCIFICRFVVFFLRLTAFVSKLILLN